MGYDPLATEIHATSQDGPRTVGYIDHIVLHHSATTNVDEVIAMMVTKSRQVSAHIAMKDTRLAGIVPEELRAWSLSSPLWDSRSFTVECANESTAGWTISDASHESLAQLCANWSRRYGIPINRSGDPRTWTVLGHREVYTIWGQSYATACPGGMDLDRIAARAIQILNGTTPTRKDHPMSINSALRTPDGSIYAQFEPGCPFLPISDINEWNGYAAATGATYVNVPAGGGGLTTYGTSTDWSKLAPSSHPVPLSLGDVTVNASDADTVKVLGQVLAAIQALPGALLDAESKRLGS